MRTASHMGSHCCNLEAINPRYTPAKLISQYHVYLDWLPLSTQETIVKVTYPELITSAKWWKRRCAEANAACIMHAANMQVMQGN